ncbi:cysteine-rich receptor-like protein kinase, partial [Trifolium pratense]
RMLATRYGVEGGNLKVGGRNRSAWWREIARIRDGLSDLDGSWFAECISKEAGDGADTFFWIDSWLGGTFL